MHFILSATLSLVALSLSATVAADSNSCQIRFEGDVAACKAEFDRCHCQACPRSRLCGGDLPPNRCGAVLNPCIATQRACRNRATQAKQICLRQ